MMPPINLWDSKQNKIRCMFAPVIYTHRPITGKEEYTHTHTHTEHQDHFLFIGWETSRNKQSIPFTKYRGKKKAESLLNKREQEYLTLPGYNTTRITSICNNKLVVSNNCNACSASTIRSIKARMRPLSFCIIRFTFPKLIKMLLAYHFKTSNINNSQYAKVIDKSSDNQYLRVGVYMITETTQTPVLNMVNYTTNCT